MVQARRTRYRVRANEEIQMVISRVPSARGCFGTEPALGKREKIGEAHTADHGHNAQYAWVRNRWHCVHV